MPFIPELNILGTYLEKRNMLVFGIWIQGVLVEHMDGMEGDMAGPPVMNAWPLEVHSSIDYIRQ